MTVLTTAELERLAQADDAEAQYALAAQFAQAQQADEAKYWLERSAALGHPDALFTLAGGLLTASEGAVERRPEAIAGLREAAARGSLAALRILAALTAAGVAGEGGWPVALGMLREACERGDAAAMREVAALLFDREPDDEDGASLLANAAETDRFAAALASRRAHRGRRTAKSATSLERAFTKLTEERDEIASEQVSLAPKIVRFRGAAGIDLCDHLAVTALPRLRRQEIVDPRDNIAKPHPHRTAWGAGLGFGFADIPSVFASQRLARLARLPHEHGEALTILRYRPGEQYHPHHDFLGPNDPDLYVHGQRIRTALLYLNEGFIGGETHFLAPNIKFAGRSGDALVFHNVDDAGAPDVSARHAGLPVLRGEKWLASLWLRDRPFAG
ncbi:MAG: 2OG-Fe(II) oxygenase [Parvularculaceae bacterium]|nr:2OG-Fe(II) oxygenase [Parvularculaceae bacterium]